MLDVVQIDHHVVTHLQCEIELVNFRTRTGVGRVLGI